MKKLLVAALMVLLASPAFAAIQNVKVSGDINSAYLDRSDFGLGALNSGAAAAAGYGDVNTPTGVKAQEGFMTQTRVRIDADLSDNVSATVRLINERTWGTAASDGSVGGGMDGVDLDLAYVTLREFLYSPLTVTIGRQEFFFGNGLIIGGGPNNSTTGHFQYAAADLTEIDSEDGIKAVLDYKPLTLTMIYYKEGQTTASLRGLYGNDDASGDVYGLNANYQLGDAMNTVVEAYLFSRINGDNFALEGPMSGTVVVPVQTAADKGDTLFVPGLRVSTNPVKGLNVQGELAGQFGTHPVTLNTINTTTGAITPGAQADERREAMALQLMANYSLPVLEKYKPAVNASFTYVSGDKNADSNDTVAGASKNTKVYGAWDEFDKSQFGGTIFNAIFPLSDMYIYTLGASACPLEDVSAAVTWSSLYSAERFSTTNPLVLIQPNGEVAAPATKAKGLGLGNEYDVNLGYAYTEDVSFGVSLGWFVPGSVFSSVNDKPASQAIANVKVAF
jgi:uncharacterized protein YdeI (BOF family)